MVKLKMNEADIEDSNGLSMLSMHIRPDRCWNQQITEATKGGAKCLGFLKRSKQFFTPTDFATIYKAYFRLKLKYNSHVWAAAL